MKASTRESLFLVLGLLVLLAFLRVPWSVTGGQNTNDATLTITKTPVTPDPLTPEDVDFLPAVLRSDATPTVTQQATPTVFVTKTPAWPSPP